VVGIVSCDLDEIEHLIIKSHLPIEDTFRFLCHSCHVAYDSGARGSRLEHREVRADIPSVDSPFRKLTRIRLWASRPQQVNHQMIKAFLLLEQGGRLQLAEFKRYCTEALGIAGFDGNYASMKTDAGGCEPWHLRRAPSDAVVGHSPCEGGSSIIRLIRAGDHMSRNLTISDELYARLETEARNL
jgi:hypothetical protein